MAKKDNFEANLARLTEIVQKLEGADLPLEDGVSLFKEGVGLATSCREKLKKAKNEVTLLTEQGLTDFDMGKADDD